MIKQLGKLLAVIGAVYVLLCTAVYLVEPEAFNNNFGDAFWFGIVTVTTVGYGDLSPSGAAGKVVTVGLFVFSVVVFSFLISNIQTIVAERSRLRALGMDGTKFTGHVVAISTSQISLVAVKELLAAGRQVAVIAEHAEQIPLVQELADRRVLFVTVGDPTSEETLNRVNIRQANTVVAASEDDTLNLICSLEIKRLNPTARIVVSTKRAELRNTLTSTGVTYVASPYELSGRLVASAAFEPEVAKFIEDVSSGADDLSEEGGDDGGYDLQQFTLPQESGLCNQTVAQVNGTLRQIQGPLLVAVAKHIGHGKYELFPHPDDHIVLSPYDSLIVLGNPPQNGRVSQMLGVIQGR